ncbi:MAG: hypothetical protein NTW04_06170, partial [Elusimicrobia bacterium]|nr:hypothetical protein [Elusimicrobiota bacterium]
HLSKKSPLLHDMISSAKVEFLPQGKWRIFFKDGFSKDSCQRSIKKITDALLEIGAKDISIELSLSAQKEPTRLEEIVSENGSAQEISDEEPFAQGSWQDIVGEPQENPELKKILKIIPGKVLRKDENI